MAKKVKEERKRKRDDVEASEPAKVEEPAPAEEAPQDTEVVGQDSMAEVPTKTKKKKEKSEKTSVKEATAAGEDDTNDDAAAAQTNAEGEEAEVVSHKEARKRRRLEKRVASLSANTATAEGQAAAPAVAVITSSASKPAPRSQYAIWVGNLSFSTTPEKLQTWLEDRGVAGITRMNMPKGARRHEHNKGFAYVDLPDETTLKYSISLSESPLDGRRLLIKDGKNFEGRPALSISAEAFATDNGDTGDPSGSNAALPLGADLLQRTANASLGKFAQSMLRSQKNAPSRTLFVGNLPFAATAEGLRELLETAEQRKVDSEKDRVEAMELKALRRQRREEKERQREEGSLAKTKKEAEEVKKAEESSSDEDDDEEEKEEEKKKDVDIDDDDDDSGSGTDSDDEDGEKKKGSKKATKDSTSKSDPIGLVKVRLATFEDNPEKCKGFAFLDFASTLHATRTLINPRNRYYLARKLVYEYAGEEAQRRSAGKKKISAEDRAAAASSKSDWKRPRGESTGRDWNDDRRGPRKSYGDDLPVRPWGQSKPDEGETTTETAAAAGEGKKPTQAERAAARLAKGRGRADDDRKMSRPAGRGGPADGRDGRRPKPGAALANAARGKVGIVASEGKKITFE
ncbi:hypothetical protein CF326_g525 [Tilletia indica]|nr:hypothetical protein CF326_g525 [Tilletia indica]